jgi:hypothetical protein
VLQRGSRPMTVLILPRCFGYVVASLALPPCRGRIPCRHVALSPWRPPWFHLPTEVGSCAITCLRAHDHTLTLPRRGWLSSCHVALEPPHAVILHMTFNNINTQLFHKNVFVQIFLGYGVFTISLHLLTHFTMVPIELPFTTAGFERKQ